MRRLIVQQPVSQAAVWSLRLSVFALTAAGVAVGLSRLAGLAPSAALTVFGAALALACLAALLAAAAVVVIWRTGRLGAGKAALGFALALALIAYPAYLGYLAVTLPPLSDVSTDFAEPPSFMISTKARAARGGRMPPPFDRAGEPAQRDAYPKVAPVFVDLEAMQAYQMALRLVKDAGWKVVDSTEPNLRGDGVAHIDAIDRSLFFGFASDITIRVTPLDNETRIDLRSVNRVGKHDFGANARRIRKFIELAQEFQQQER